MWINWREKGFYTRMPMQTDSWTLPSHASIFTGMYLSKHGAHNDPCFEKSYTREQKQKLALTNDFIFKLSRVLLTLAEILSARGYRTAGIIGGHFTSSAYGLAQGFDYYNENFYTVKKQVNDMLYPATFSLEDIIMQYGYSGYKRIGSHLNEVAFKWLEENYKKPFFLLSITLMPIILISRPLLTTSTFRRYLKISYYSITLGAIQKLCIAFCLKISIKITLSPLWRRTCLFPNTMMRFATSIIVLGFSLRD